MLRHYNAIGYAIVLCALAAGTFLFPLHGDHALSFAVTLGYFAFVWFLGGIYIGDVVHLGLAHRSLDVKPWFVVVITALNNTLGVYLNLVTWCNRHRLHHANADHPGDPNKRPEDGFWATFYRSQVPYPSSAYVLKESIFASRAIRFFNNPLYALISGATSFGILWLVVGEWRFALTLWLGIRLIASYILWIQNYWAHDRRYGTRRYDDDDNSMNIIEVLPVLLTFSACLQNNHHHNPKFVRLSQSPAEFDWGFVTVRWLCRVGLAAPTEAGRVVPDGASLQDAGV